MTKIQKKTQRFLILLTIVSMLLPMLLVGSTRVTDHADLARLQPELVQMAAESPDAVVRVIVQKADESDRAERYIEYLGGEVIKELKLINAFVAQLPAARLPQLSECGAVNWVSYDARMYPAVSLTNVAPDYYLRDEFNSETYNGNDGTVAWLGGWQEFGESDGPTDGDVRVKDDDDCSSGRCVRIKSDEDSFDGLGLRRGADLRGADAATLSFDLRRDYDEGKGYLYPMVSSDGGFTWSKLANISLNIDDKSFVSHQYDLTPYLSAKFMLQFYASSKELEAKIFIDNVEIAYTVEKNTFSQTLDLGNLHENGITGQGIGVAIIDSGIGEHKDLVERVYSSADYGLGDAYGHGTHVSGIAGGNGYVSQGQYIGVAPQANFISLGVSDAQGMAYESDVVYAMQWVFENKAAYNIRVVNLSLNSTVEDSYHNSPIPAAAEILWFNDIVVVASVGNTGAGGEYNTACTSPANDPFIITVGASDEKGTLSTSDDIIANFSAYGTTFDGHERPDLIAPGYNIVSALSPDSTWDDDYPERVGISGQYIRLSGTSMSAPMVTGVVALLLQDEPNLTPDQVKYRLLDTASDLGGYPYLNGYAAIHGTSTESANQGLMPHMLLAKMAMIAYWASVNGAEDIDWGNVDWGSVNWNSVNWNSVNWSSVNWNSVNWNSVNWNSVNWNSVNWNSVNWNSVNWNSVNWNSVNWNSVNWNAVELNAVDWDGN